MGVLELFLASATGIGLLYCIFVAGRLSHKVWMDDFLHQTLLSLLASNFIVSSAITA
jgi:hypothetical protein